MRLRGRQITSPRVDAVALLLAAWCLMDVAAVAYVKNAAVGIAIGLAAIASCVVAVWCWRRPSA